MEGSRHQVCYIVRHGVRLDFEDRNWKKTATNRDDPPLAQSGLQQAQEVANFLKDNAKVDAVFSSSFQRCVCTADFVAAAFDVPIDVELGISEWPEKHVVRLPPIPPLATMFPRVDLNYKSLVEVSGDEESVIELHERCFRLVRLMDEAGYFLTTKSDSEGATSQPRTLVFVTHAATAVALTRAFLHDTKFKGTPGTCTITELRRNHDRPEDGWQLVKNGYSGHLTSGSLYDWGFSSMYDRQLNGE